MLMNVVLIMEVVDRTAQTLLEVSFVHVCLAMCWMKIICWTATVSPLLCKHNNGLGMCVCQLVCIVACVYGYTVH